jgi:hypothetical protein
MTDTAIIDRVVTTEVLTLPAGVTAVENTAPIASTGSYAVYVTRTQHPQMDPNNVGRIQRCTGSAVAGAFINEHATARVWGAIVNPEPVNGRTYYVKDRFIARFNDVEHRADRHFDSSPWSIIAGHDNSPWPYPSDSVSTIADETYFEVNLAGVSDVGQAVADAEIPVPAEVRPVADNSSAGPFYGMGASEEDGTTVLLDPEREFGKLYILAVGGGNNPRVATWVKGESGEGEWRLHGYLGRYSRQTELESMLHLDPLPAVNWVKARMRRRDVVVHRENTLASLNTELANERSKWSSMNEALNEMATDKGHCSDYDAIVEAVGLDPRTKNWDVEVEVEVQFTDTSPSSNLDSRLGYEYGITMEASSVTVTAKVNITVTVEASSSDAARDNVSTTEIEDRLESDLPSDFTVIDWTITNASRSDD